MLSRWGFSIGGSRTTDWWNCILLVQREGYRYAFKHVILLIITMKYHSFTTNMNRTNSKACWSHDFTIPTRRSTQISNFTTWTSGDFWTKNIGQNLLHSKTTRGEGGEKRRRERVLGLVTPILVQRQALISSVAAKHGHETKKKHVLIGCQTWRVLLPKIWSLTAIKANCRAKGKLFLC